MYISNPKGNNILSTRIISAEELEEQKIYAQKVRSATHIFDKAPLAYVHSYGCQQNVTDGEKIKGMLEEMGYGFTDDTANADFILFNTCAVRENAVERVFGNVGALKHLKKKNPKLIIAVCGCMVQQPLTAEKLKKSFPFVDIIFGTHVLHTLPQLLCSCLFEGGRVFEIPDSDGVIAEGLPVKRDSSFKASVPIRYGSNNFCTYCVVPYVRGRERSRASQEVIAEVKGLVDNGYKDILLLGQNVNSYGKGTDVDFPELLTRLDKLPGEFKIEFMTSHPKDCTKRLIDVIAGSDKISYHLHLPIQCGSDRILALMNRHYDVKGYLELVDYAREKIPDLNLTTDIIVGFPGEMREDFDKTLDLMKRVCFDSAFTFIFSPREGTKAANMEDTISEEEKGKWFRELLQVQTDCGSKSYQKYIGKTLRVLCEGRGRTSQEYFNGKSMQNIIVDFTGDESDIGKFVDVKITKALGWALIGEKV